MRQTTKTSLRMPGPQNLPENPGGASTAAYVSFQDASPAEQGFPATSLGGSEAAANPCRKGVVQERARLAFVIDNIHDWRLGGTERQLAHLVKTLDAKVFEPIIFVLQPSAGVAAEGVGCPVVLVNESANQSRVRTLLNLRAALKRFRPHVVQTFFIDGIFYGTAAACLNRVPVLVQARRNAGHWQKRYHTLALRLCNRAVDYWQCNSQCVAEMLERVEGVPRERVSILSNAIDVSRFAPASPEQRCAARRELGLPPDAPVFVMVCTLRTVKGLPSLIEAGEKLRLCLPDVHVLIVGEGPERAVLAEKIAQLNLQDVVRLVGGHEDVRPYLRSADVAVLTSHSESSSNALLEYMAMGLPAVVSDIPANRELVDGEFFPAGDAAALADKLLWLWNHAEIRREMASRNRAKAMEYGEVPFSQRVQSYYLGLALPYLNELSDGRLRGK